MLSSQTGAALSGAGSAAGKSAGHGAVLMGAGVRAGFARGLGPLQAGAMGLGMPGRFEPDKEGPPHVCSGSDADSDSGDEDEPMGSIGDGRRAGGVKRERAEMEAAMVGPKAGLPSGVLAGGVAGAKPGKKTRGRVKIKMEFIDNKLRRYTTFSKRKTGIMKKVSRSSELLHTGLELCLLLYGALLEAVRSGAVGLRGSCSSAREVSLCCLVSRPSVGDLKSLTTDVTAVSFK
uniref:MADS-box domain-containing protein n=1 Tax=Cyprinus carpio TaxID=7962 RepID=A0A8C1W383_CYPCA